MPPIVEYVLGVGAVLLALVLAGGWLAAGIIVRRREPDPADPPANYGLTSEHVTFTARDGMRLGGRLIGPYMSSAEAARQRPTIIFAPGLFGSMDGDTHMAPLFIRAGFDVFQFDWRGHGISDGRRVTLGVREIADLQGAVDWLQAWGVRRIGVLGFSLGGAVALRAAARDERIAAVVCDGGFVQIAHAIEGYLREKTGLPLRPLAWLVLRMASLRLGGLRLADANPLPVAGAISPRPVLLIHGAQDPFVPVPDQDAIFAACGEPKTLWRIADAAHREAYERQPEQYEKRVTGFFKQHLHTSL